MTDIDAVKHTPEGQMSTHPWSAPEKKILCDLLPKSPVLDYPMQKRKAANGDFEAIYLIPPEDKEKVFRQCWPYEGWTPDMDTQLMDLHSRQLFAFKDMMVMWHEWRNILVCPDYLNTGGTVIDMVPPENTTGIGIVFKTNTGRPALVVVQKTKET